MKDEFMQSQWQELCDHLGHVADQMDADRRALSTFCDQEPPLRYPELLDRVRQAARVADGWRNRTASHQHDEEMIDEASDESFPASDPPSFSHSHA